MRAFVGVIIAAVALGGALAMSNEVRNSHTTSTPSRRVWCGYSGDTRLTCQTVHTYAIGDRLYYDEPATSYTTSSRPGWVNPAAITLAIAGVGCGLLLVAQGVFGRPVRKSD